MEKVNFKPLGGFTTMIIQTMVNFNEILNNVWFFLYLTPKNIESYFSTIQNQLIFHQIFKILFWFFFVLVCLHSILYLIMGFVGSFSKIHKTPLLEHGSEPLVTILIPTRNELAAIRCAKRCLNFDYPPEKMQIIIGDDSDDPEIMAIMDEYANENRGKIQIHRRKSNLGFKPGNLNSMLPVSKGEYIVVFDSDFLPQPDFLRKMLYPLENDLDLVLTQARWRLQNFDQNIFSIMGGIVSFYAHYAAYPFLKAIGANSYLGGSGYVIRKSTILEIGGWLEGTLTEDSDASLELLKRGKKMLYLEDVLVDCEVPFSLEDTYKQQKRWAFGNITTFKRNLIGVLRSKKTKLVDKISVLIFVTGYIYPFLLAFLIFFSLLQFIVPNPFLPPLPVYILLLNFLIGFLFSQVSFFTSCLVLFKNDKKHLIPTFIWGTFLYGMVILYHVNIGALKALFGKKMEWFLLEKKGNNIANNIADNISAGKERK